MVIGILTFHHVYNYGALLQVYALQRFLTELGNEVEVIDVRPFRRAAPFVARVNRYLRPFAKILARLGWLKPDLKTRRFDSFRKSHINLSNYYKELSCLSDTNTRHNVLIVGSDQVWNPKYGRRALDTYFAIAAGKGAKRIGYAVCCGSGSIDEAKLKPYTSDMLGFHKIGARDGFTKQLVKTLSGRDVEVVVDPTLLINWDDFNSNEDFSHLPEKYIFYYGFSARGDTAAHNLSAQTNLPIVNVGMEVDHQIREGFQLNDLGPLEWVKVMRHSHYVVTKSFHGLMLALKLRKPFLIIPPEDPSAARLVDAAKRFNAEDALLRPGEMPDENYIQRAGSINWSSVWQLVDDASFSSRDFLNRAL